jgi:hypothetical protein
MKKQVINYKKLELISVPAPESAIQAFEDLMVFDARCLDKKRGLNCCGSPRINADSQSVEGALLRTRLCVLSAEEN